MRKNGKIPGFTVDLTGNPGGQLQKKLTSSKGWGSTIFSGKTQFIRRNGRKQMVSEDGHQSYGKSHAVP